MIGPQNRITLIIKLDNPYRVMPMSTWKHVLIKKRLVVRLGMVVHDLILAMGGRAGGAL